MPFGVVIDTEICLQAPEILWLSGVGDLAAKCTAGIDWKRAFHAKGEPVDDFSALLSEASFYEFLARPMRDLEGMRLLGTTLILSGVAMSIGGSSRPASGSEHLISHALDHLSTRPRLHGLQVGIATYLMSLVQGANTERIARLFDETNFWSAIHADPFIMTEWQAALKVAPGIKLNYYTVLSEPGAQERAAALLMSEPRFQKCFVYSGPTGL
jgi:glycerol-1-phosphate dehydrogenase [NAD(P)+]